MRAPWCAPCATRPASGGSPGSPGARMVRDGLALRHGKDLTWSQVLLAANTPVLLRSAMVDGRTDLGVMAAGQVAGVIDDLPSCAELVERIMKEAEEALTSLGGSAPLSDRHRRPLTAAPPLGDHRTATR